MSKPNFSDEVKEKVLERANWICEHCHKNKIEDFHHRLINSKYNRKKYKSFIQSSKNCVSLCRVCHSSGLVRNKYKISDEEAQRLEESCGK